MESERDPVINDGNRGLLLHHLKSNRELPLADLIPRVLIFPKYESSLTQNDSQRTHGT